MEPGFEPEKPDVEPKELDVRSAESGIEATEPVVEPTKPGVERTDDPSTWLCRECRSIFDEVEQTHEQWSVGGNPRGWEGRYFKHVRDLRRLILESRNPGILSKI